MTVARALLVGSSVRGTSFPPTSTYVCWRRRSSGGNPARCPYWTQYSGMIPARSLELWLSIRKLSASRQRGTILASARTCTPPRVVLSTSRTALRPSSATTQAPAGLGSLCRSIPMVSGHRSRCSGKLMMISPPPSHGARTRRA